MEKYTVDRIEGDFVVLEKEDMTCTEKKLTDFPFEIKEGNIIVYDNGEYSFDFNEEKLRKAEILKKQRKIFKNK